MDDEVRYTAQLPASFQEVASGNSPDRYPARIKLVAQIEVSPNGRRIITCDKFVGLREDKHAREVVREIEG